MPTTANYAIPTPGLTGVTPDVPRDLQAMADVIDDVLHTEANARVAATVPGAMVTTAWTAATGWTVDSQQSYVMGKLLFTYLTFTRTDPDIAAPADGNIGNSKIAQLGASYTLQSTIQTALGAGGTGRLCGYVVNATGGLFVCSVGVGGNLLTGTQLTCGGVLLLA